MEDSSVVVVVVGRSGRDGLEEEEVALHSCSMRTGEVARPENRSFRNHSWNQNRERKRKNIY